MDFAPMQRTVKILNTQGFHMRPIQEFVELAAKFQAQVQVYRPNVLANEKANGKSVLDLLMMATLPGEELTVEVLGDDGAQALDILIDYLESLPQREKEIS